jgi:beta-galactosidase
MWIGDKKQLPGAAASVHPRAPLDNDIGVSEATHGNLTPGSNAGKAAGHYQAEAALFAVHGRYAADAVLIT